MRRLASLYVLSGIFVLSTFAAVKTFNNVPVLPVYCAEKSAPIPTRTSVPAE